MVDSHVGVRCQAVRRDLPVAIIEGYANVAELVDALDLGSSAARRGGSSPFIRTRLFSMLAVEQIASGRRA